MDRAGSALDASERHALVLGGSVAGLLAARVLADHFDRVTVVDRDSFPVEPIPRRGVPQSHHIHVLLLRGREILEELLPGFEQDLAAAGAPFLDALRDLAWLTPKGWAVRFPSRVRGYAASRPLLEWAIRRRVAANPRVRILGETTASGLVANEAKSRVVGAVLRRANGGHGSSEEVQAELVVDATGRGSQLPERLHDLGYPTPEQTVVDSFLGYSSRLYRVPEHRPAGWKGLYIQIAPPADLRGGVVHPLEGERWIVTLGGAGRDYPPTDESGFQEFARSLRSPILYEAIRNAEPLSPIYGTRGTANVVTHYERLPRLPDGLVVLGDAVCVFNPVYGQGMTTAAMGAMVLGECLREAGSRPDTSDGAFPRRFQQRLAQSNKTAWLIATGEDLRVPGAKGKRPGRSASLMYSYLDRAVKLSTKDPYARQVLNDVISLETPISALFHPRLAARMLWGPVGSPRSTPVPASA